ncbi:MAG: methionine--tRNA ligase [Rhodobiaceae bacterium]|nr:MAG: methionine--tRNA ligase [Rhodobiaceae bacterium]
MTASKTDPKSFYITTPIYYVNDVPHIGHAYTTLACDVLARFKRLDGYDVLFLTGNDEHGQKVEKSAEAQGITPQELCAQVSGRFQALAEVMNFSIDDFIRTTEPRHKDAVQAIWRKMADKGDIYLDKYAGWYSVRDEAFYGEDELVEGDDGEKLAPTGAPVEWVEEPSYFFRLSAYQDRLLELFNKPGFILPESRRNEVASFVKGGLKDLSISRTTFNWGVQVPDDPDHVVYVWLDALTNYIAATGYPDTQNELFAKFWPADLHVIGKDILRFHTVYWPAFLMSADIELPKRVFAHGWWTNEGQKISKSLGNVIDPFELVDTYGLDPVRYFMLREVPFGNDGDFSKTALVNRTNADLANDLGNLAQRSLSMLNKNLGGIVPEPVDLRPQDQAILDQADAMLEAVRRHMDANAIHKALGAIWDVVSETNRYFAGEEPWALTKTDPTRMGTVLYVTAEIVRNVALLAQPIVPAGAAKLLDVLGVPEDERSFEFCGASHRLKPGVELPKPEPVFPRYVEPETAA